MRLPIQNFGTFQFGSCAGSLFSLLFPYGSHGSHDDIPLYFIIIIPRHGIVG
jgi:hypothetical protein